MAVLFGAFLLHGIIPGPLLMQNNLDVVAIVVISALAANVTSSIFSIGAANQLTRLTRIDIMYVAPIVIAVAFFGSYALQNNVFNLVITAFFGLLGFLMIQANMSRIPMILGLVLGPIVEEQFFRALMISGNDYSIFVNMWLDWVLIGLVVLSLTAPYLRRQLAERGVLSV